MQTVIGSRMPVLHGSAPVALRRMGQRVDVVERRDELKELREQVAGLTAAFQAIALTQSQLPVVVATAPQYPAVPPAPHMLEAPRAKKHDAGLLEKAQAFMRHMAD